MHKIVEEPKLLGHKEVNGQQVPVYSCKTETVITNKNTFLLFFNTYSVANTLCYFNFFDSKKVFWKTIFVWPHKLWGLGKLLFRSRQARFDSLPFRFHCVLLYFNDDQ